MFENYNKLKNVNKREECGYFKKTANFNSLFKFSFGESGCLKWEINI